MGEKEQLAALLGKQVDVVVKYHGEMMDARAVAREYLNEWLYMVAMRDGIRAALGRWAKEMERNPWLEVELSREPDQKGE